MKFVAGAWVNRKYTTLRSSFILGFILAVALCAALLPPAATKNHWGTVFALAMFLILEALFYPLAREMYYRFTAPLRRGVGGFLVAGPLAILGRLGRLFAYCILWWLSLPIGVIGLIYLGLEEHHEKGWRLSR